MKKIFPTLALAACLCGFVSCNNEEQELPLPKQMDNELEAEITNGGSMLKFKDVKAYEDALFKISHMEFQERYDYLRSLPFKPQALMMQEADKELEQICNQTNKRSEFDILYQQYKQKYGKIFMFNETDSTDLSPYSRLVYATDEVFVNENGQFMIGDSLINSKVYRDFQERQQQFTVSASTRSISDLKSVNDAYSRQSDRKVGMQLALGSSVDFGTNLIHVTFTSQKKGLFGWSRYSTRYFSNVHITGANFEFANGVFFGVQPAFVPRSGVAFSLESREMGGNVTMIFGRRSSTQRCTGAIEIWSRGVPYDKRGKSSVDL